MIKKMIVIVFCVLLVGCSKENSLEENTSIEISLENEVIEMNEAEIVEEVLEEEILEEEFESVKKVRIIIDALNARSEGSLDSEVIGSVRLNEIYDVYEMDKYEDWYKVKLSTGEYAWISGWYSRDIELLDEEDSEGRTLIIEVLNDTVDVFSEKNIEDEIIYEITIGGRYEILDTDLNDDGDAWYKISPETGIVGWIQGQYAKEYYFDKQN